MVESAAHLVHALASVQATEQRWIAYQRDDSVSGGWIPRMSDEHRAVAHERVHALAEQTHDDQKSEEWLAKRRKRITASSVAAALCMGTVMFTEQRTTRAYDLSERVLLEKSGFAERFAGNAATEHGAAKEPVAVEHYMQAEQTHVALYGLMVDRRRWWIGASPDAVCLHSGRLVEIKCPYSRYPKPQSPIPHQYVPQCYVQLIITDLQECDYYDFKEPTSRSPHRINHQRICRQQQRVDEWARVAFPILERFVVHLYRLKALAEIFEPPQHERRVLHRDLYGDPMRGYVADGFVVADNEPIV